MKRIEYKIYKLVDPTNNLPRYIGLTFNSLTQRLKSHRNENSKSHKSYWIKSLSERGLKPKIELIESGIESYETACEREIYWIFKFKQEGFDLTNSTGGGDKNKKMSDESRLKMSNSQRERHKTYKMIFTDEIRSKISESTKIRMSDPKEIRKLKISNKKYEDSKTEEQKINDTLIQKSRKIIIQYDLDMNIIQEYPSIRRASNISKVEKSNITRCCNKKVSTAGGFIWRFQGDISPMVEDKRHNRKTKSVIQYDLDMSYIAEFKSAKDASNKTIACQSGIFACCNGKFKSAGGFIWKYK